jgi:type IV pilus assembly protein PilM
MARSLIGLDVGTNAVTVAEVVAGDPPRLAAFGQVALARDAMRDGEVVDANAVADAIRRLRGEVGIRRGGVRVGMASPRLIVRQVEMPVMSHDDLAGALRFQAADLIPFPIDEAFTDFAILDQYQPIDGEPVMRVLLAAAQQTMVETLVRAVESAGLAVDAVDLIPLALIRSLGAGSAFVGAEGIVSLGGGTSCVIVHEAGVPRFVRVLGSGGRQLTDAISASLELAPDAAESIKRQIGTGGDPVVDQARAVIDRPLGVLLDEVRSSIDYYRNQPGATPLHQVVVTGGTGQLAGVIERLSGLLGVSVFPGDVRSRLTIGDIGFAPEELPRLDPYLPAAVGLAIVDPARGPVMNLLPGGRRVVNGGDNKTKYLVGGAVGAALLAAALAYPVIQRRDDAAKADREAARLEAANEELQAKINAPELQELTNSKLQLEALKVQITSALATDVSWATLIHEVAKTMPNDVWLTSFSGQVEPTAVSGPGGTTTGTNGGASTESTNATVGSTNTAVGSVAGVSSAGTLVGSVTFEAVGLDFPSVAAWIDGIHEVMKLEGVWVPNATRSAIDESLDVVNFTSSAALTDNARSDRAEAFAAGEDA